MSSFLEAAFYSAATPAASPVWRDRSDADYFMFESSFGAVRLRKRLSYPATFMETSGSRLFFGYGEFGAGRAVASQKLHDVPEETFYDSEFLFVGADAARQTVTVQRDALSTLPLFAGQQPDRLVISNRFDRVVALVDRAQLTLDTVALAEFLCSLETYDRTFCQEIKLIYDRVRLEWSPHIQTYIQPPHAKRAHKHLLPKSDIRELRMQLEHTIDMYYRRYVGDGQPFGCDLSGGMDSALVAGYLKSKGHDPLAVTMLLDGTFGIRQQQKIQALQQRFAFKYAGRPLRFDAPSPLDFLEVREQPFYHYQLGVTYGIYNELMAYLASQGASVVFGGQGGDELCDNIPDHTPTMQEDLVGQLRIQETVLPSWWTPAFREYLHTAAVAARQGPERSVPIVSSSMASIWAHGSRALFDSNVWPVNPLAHPRLYAYAQGLPIRYRHERNLTHMYLIAQRFPSIMYEDSKEHFGEHIFQATIRHAHTPLRDYLSQSRLAACGLLDAKKAADSLAIISTAPYSQSTQEVANNLLTILGAEINLHNLGLYP